MILTSDSVTALSPERNFFFFLLGCLGAQKFRFHLRLCSLGIKSWESWPVHRVIRNSESFPGLCSLVDQKFWILLCLCRGSEFLNPFVCQCRGSEILNLWGIRNSESFVVFFGDQKFGIVRCILWGSEILNPFLCCLGDQKFWISRQEIPNRNKELLGRIFWFLANRENFHVSFNTILRFRRYCKNHIRSKVKKNGFPSKRYVLLKVKFTRISRGTSQSAT